MEEGTASGAAPVARANFVYALGSVEHRFPSLGIEKEFAQATGRADTATQPLFLPLIQFWQ